MMISNFPQLAIIGAGNMATHMLSGLKRAGFPLHTVCVTDRDAEKLETLSAQFGVKIQTDNVSAIAQAAVVILAIKPQSMHAFAKEVRTAFAHAPLVISIAAGIPLEKLHGLFGDDLPLIRAMPNVCVSIAEGNTILFTQHVSPHHMQLANDFFSRLGIVQWVQDEKQLNAYTVLTGTGPGYVFYLLQNIIDAAHDLGIPHDEAKKAVLQLFSGAAHLALHSDASITQLQQQVTSKKGVTEQVLNTLAAGNMEALFAQAFKNAYAHNEQLQHITKE